MKNTNKRGFTLVEMLVVVIIIGILASIALPAYQKSVEQSRAAQIWPLLKSMANAAQVYSMSRGNFPTTFDSLSVLPPSWSGTEKFSTWSYITDTRSDGEWSLQMYPNSGYGNLVIYAGRLKGKYKGAGFRIQIKKGTSPLTDEMVITCVERENGGLKFEEPAGAYCVDIFDGKPADYSDSLRYYYLP